MKVLRNLVLLTTAATLAGTLAAAAPAYARAKIIVHPGESIQAAVDRADPGDKIIVEPGTYAQTVDISKRGITLAGTVSQGPRTILVPPSEGGTACDFGGGAAHAPAPRGDGHGAAVGICVHGDFHTGAPVRDVVVSGFQVLGFAAFGVEGVLTRDFRVSYVWAGNNLEYGITDFEGTGTHFDHNKTYGAEEAGIYVGDTPYARARVLNNESYGNAIGILIRNASYGTVSGNSVHNNCAGMVLVAHAPGPVRYWTVRQNAVNKNNLFCSGDPSEGRPSFSGAGIVVLGAQNSDIVDNTVDNNRPSAAADVSGGILVVKAGRHASPNNDVIGYNTALGNRPFDIFWDGTGFNVEFPENFCGDSYPAWICG